jgi:hypothetical protein
MKASIPLEVEGEMKASSKKNAQESIPKAFWVLAYGALFALIMALNHPFIHGVMHNLPRR